MIIWFTLCLFWCILKLTQRHCRRFTCRCCSLSPSSWIDTHSLLHISRMKWKGDHEAICASAVCGSHAEAMRNVCLFFSNRHCCQRRFLMASSRDTLELGPFLRLLLGRADFFSPICILSRHLSMYTHRRALGDISAEIYREIARMCRRVHCAALTMAHIRVYMSMVSMSICCSDAIICLLCLILLYMLSAWCSFSSNHILYLFFLFVRFAFVWHILFVIMIQCYLFLCSPYSVLFFFSATLFSASSRQRRKRRKRGQQQQWQQTMLLKISFTDMVHNLPVSLAHIPQPIHIWP